MMLKYAVLLALVSCTLLVSVKSQAWNDMKDRLKDRVIHMESILKRGRWLSQNDNTDSDGSRYLFVDELAERDTYYTPRVQFQTSECGGGKYLCLEPLNLRDYFLTAGFPAGGSKYTVKLEHSTYPEGDNRFHWKIMCTSDTLMQCKFVPVRFEGETCHLMITDNHGSEGGYSGGHYDGTLGYEEGYKAWWRVHAPNPGDGYNEIYENINTGTTDQLVKYSTKVGVSQTHEESYEVTSTVSTEIGGAFKALSASVSSSISESWSTTDSTTYEAAKTVEHDLTLKGRTRVVMKQLIGHYADEFDVGSDKYLIEEHDLDDESTRTSTVTFENGVKTIEKDEL